ncbi:RNA-directed DNA polymerase from mobile element jockey-like 43 [Homarus americanus]|uniref:RNA-directed DNA polymerase from mobile element jockey-like 43 n=1 Tax=Homarus americanus TaxID=6706 RepID=A0A8J5KBU7_HOMAM|nr:RNA-directed DNA polymerase from mobile element jockey-like 43 [Homarus americanus]
MQVAMAKIQPQNTTEAPQSTFLWGQQQQKTVNPTPTPPQMSEDSCSALPPPGCRTKLKTPGQNQSCTAVKAQNTRVMVENSILPGTLQPPQATTQLNTPQPANLQAAFTEEQIKQVVTIMVVTVSTIIKKQDTSTENITNAVMTQLTEEMQEDHTPKTPQLQVEQTTPLRAGARETATNEHTILNGRGGERLDHERREQLQHQRREDNDRIAPPPCHLKITQWNIQGLSNKRRTVQAAAIAKNMDVFILQETLMSKDEQFRLPGYQQYSVPKGPNSHGSMIFLRVTIPSSEVEPVHCGDGVEAQAVRIHLANDSLVVYNIYKPPPKRLEGGEF